MLFLTSYNSIEFRLLFLICHAPSANVMKRSEMLLSIFSLNNYLFSRYCVAGGDGTPSLDEGEAETRHRRATRQAAAQAEGGWSEGEANKSQGRWRQAEAQAPGGGGGATGEEAEKKHRRQGPGHDSQHFCWIVWDFTLYMARS